MNKTINMAIADFKLIFRDPSLRVFLALPLVLFALFIWFLPALLARFEFLQEYLPVFLVFGVIENTQMFCFISSMVFIEEKETRVAEVYGIVPLHKLNFILLRLFIPFLITVLLNVILLTIQPFYQIGLIHNLVISILAGMVVPVYVLTINLFADNRMQAMVYIKAMNMIVLVPVAAFFVPESFRLLFGIFPTHWLFQSVAQVTEGISYGMFALIGFLFFLLLLFGVTHRFTIKQFGS